MESKMCEDFPCCGHEQGCCPDYDESGRQLNMKCTCGASVPLSSRSSLCDGCYRQLLRDDGVLDYYEYDDEEDLEGPSVQEDAHLEAAYEDLTHYEE